jgi:hypothetical protein
MRIQGSLHHVRISRWPGSLASCTLACDCRWSGCSLTGCWSAGLKIGFSSTASTFRLIAQVSDNLCRRSSLTAHGAPRPPDRRGSDHERPQISAYVAFWTRVSKSHFIGLDRRTPLDDLCLEIDVYGGFWLCTPMFLSDHLVLELSLQISAGC